jgi:hypothetical protein
MTYLLNDTCDKVESYRIRQLSKLSPEERFSRMNRLCAFGKMAMIEGLREKNPSLSEDELRILLAKNLYGNKFADYLKQKINKYFLNE